MKKITYLLLLTILSIASVHAQTWKNIKLTQVPQGVDITDRIAGLKVDGNFVYYDMADIVQPTPSLRDVINVNSDSDLGFTVSGGTSYSLMDVNTLGVTDSTTGTSNLYGDQLTFASISNDNMLVNSNTISHYNAGKTNTINFQKASLGNCSFYFPDKATGTYTLATTSDLDTKADLVDGVVPQTQLPDEPKEVQEYADYASFPVTGTLGVVYIDLNTGLGWSWNGGGYVGLANSKISGLGTTNYIPKFSNALTIGNSRLFDNGTNIGINTSTPLSNTIFHIRQPSGTELSRYLTCTTYAGVERAYINNAGNVWGQQFISVSNFAVPLETGNFSDYSGAVKFIPHRTTGLDYWWESTQRIRYTGNALTEALTTNDLVTKGYVDGLVGGGGSQNLQQVLDTAPSTATSVSVGFTDSVITLTDGTMESQLLSSNILFTDTGTSANVEANAISVQSGDYNSGINNDKLFSTNSTTNNSVNVKGLDQSFTFQKNIDTFNKDIAIKATNCTDNLTFELPNKTTGTYTLATTADISGGTLDTVPTDTSTNGVESNGVFDALALKANLASPTFTGTVSGITTAMVTAGSNKYYITANQTSTLPHKVWIYDVTNDTVLLDTTVGGVTYYANTGAGYIELTSTTTDKLTFDSLTAEIPVISTNIGYNQIANYAGLNNGFTTEFIYNPTSIEAIYKIMDISDDSGGSEVSTAMSNLKGTIKIEWYVN